MDVDGRSGDVGGGMWMGGGQWCEGWIWMGVGWMWTDLDNGPPLWPFESHLAVTWRRSPGTPGEKPTWPTWRKARLAEYFHTISQ